MITEEFKIIEGIPFSACLNTASGFTTLLYFLEENEILNSMICHLELYFSDHALVYHRLLELLVQSGKPEYAHPHDTAIVAYLYVLDKAKSHLATKAQQAVANAPRLFWAKKYAAKMAEDTTIQATVFPYHTTPKVGDMLRVTEIADYSDGMYGPQIAIKLEKIDV